MPVSGQVNKVQVRGKLEVQSEIIIDERYPKTTNLPSMPASGQLNNVQVSGELEIQNIIATGESCPNSCQASIHTLSKDNWTMKLKAVDGSSEFDFEGKHKDKQYFRVRNSNMNFLADYYYRFFFYLFYKFKI